MVRTILRGSFRLEGSDAWWSDEVYLMLGLAPGDVRPSLDVLLRHVDPAWHERLRGDLAACADGDGAVVGGLYPVRDLTGRRRYVALAAVGAPEAGVSGDVADVTESIEGDVADEVNARLADAVRDQAALEQALGVLALVQGVDRRTAFAMLRWSADRRGLAVATAARRLVAAAGRVRLPEPERARLDALVDAATRRPGTPAAVRPAARSLAAVS
ncbi:ANTAR domain-containing protein [Luteimicrobium sp. NPDC057192]|uniref:ANTAR domain-containing protein n=1 Tax=Luteimicrobium sp. NPDC057192 TaxID=3346042 RepID=UPI0036314717